MKRKTTEKQQVPYEKKTYFYIGLGAMAASVVAFGLAFTALGIYALISSVILSLGALAFLNTQKKKNNFKGLSYAAVAAYILLAFLLLFFLGGLVVSALSNAA